MPSLPTSMLSELVGRNDLEQPDVSRLAQLPFPVRPQPARPLTADAAAYYAPTFVPGCSQFCVEFAGDFVSQNITDGSASTSALPGPDGTIDFRIVNGTRQIMWYGLARSVVGDGQVLASWNSDRPDVNTVQNIWGPIGALPTGVQAYTFEEMPQGNTTNNANSANPTTYVAAWHPKKDRIPGPSSSESPGRWTTRTTASACRSLSNTCSPYRSWRRRWRWNACTADSGGGSSGHRIPDCSMACYC